MSIFIDPTSAQRARLAFIGAICDGMVWKTAQRTMHLMFEMAWQLEMDRVLIRGSAERRTASCVYCTTSLCSLYCKSTRVSRPPLLMLDSLLI